MARILALLCYRCYVDTTCGYRKLEIVFQRAAAPSEPGRERPLQTSTGPPPVASQHLERAHGHTRPGHDPRWTEPNGRSVKIIVRPPEDPLSNGMSLL